MAQGTGINTAGQAEAPAKPAGPAKPAETAKAAKPAKPKKAPKYERIFDMPMQKVPGVKRAPRGFARFAEVVLAVGFKVLFRYRVDNREGFDELADGQGVVVVANHTSFLDTICIYLAILPHHLPRFIGRDKLFENGGGALGWILAHVGVIPITRDSADRTAIKRAARLLKMNEIIVIFPEGTRRGKGDIEPEMHGGAALIARMGKAPLIPITVRDADKVKQKGKMVRFPKITMEFGEPVEVSDFDFLPKDQRLEGCAWYVMRDCFALSQRIPREQVDMVALFPHARDYADVFAEHPIHGDAEAQGGTKL